MYIDFETLPETARLWVYPCNRSLTTDEEYAILQETEAFLHTWTAHQQALKAACLIDYNQFLVLAVDENYAHASGCSIDKSVHFMQTLAQKFSLSLFDRTQQAFLINDAVVLIPLRELKQAIADGKISKDTLAFNLTITTIAQFQTQWLKPAGETWLSRYFQVGTVSV